MHGLFITFMQTVLKTVVKMAMHSAVHYFILFDWCVLWIVMCFDLIGILGQRCLKDGSKHFVHVQLHSD